ncbi:MAG TPA: hypothetical protein VG711_00900 [Phycisphaerales bacterium]|nr:hypothetical protein [Phycisphaerales bacterium]
MSQFPNAPSDFPNAGFASESSAMDQSISTWPRTIGVISLIYAILGLICTGGMGLASVFSEKLMAMGGMNVQVPAIVKIRDAGLLGVAFILGILMIAASISLLRRRSFGVKGLKLWAMLRMVLVVLGIGAIVLTANADVQFARAQEQAIDDMSKQGHKPPPAMFSTKSLSDKELYAGVIIQRGVIAGIHSIYPIIIMIILSRRKIADEVAQWDLPPAY